MPVGQPSRPVRASDGLGLRTRPSGASPSPTDGPSTAPASSARSRADGQPGRPPGPCSAGRASNDGPAIGDVAGRSNVSPGRFDARTRPSARAGRSARRNSPTAVTSADVDLAIKSAALGVSPSVARAGLAAAAAAAGATGESSASTSRASAPAGSGGQPLPTPRLRTVQRRRDGAEGLGARRCRSGGQPAVESGLRGRWSARSRGNDPARCPDRRAAAVAARRECRSGRGRVHVGGSRSNGGSRWSGNQSDRPLGRVGLANRGALRSSRLERADSLGHRRGSARPARVRSSALQAVCNRPTARRPALTPHDASTGSGRTGPWRGSGWS